MEKERGITIVDEKQAQEIEDLAWQVFLMRTGLRFKQELTPEEKQQIADSDKAYYSMYREEARRIYEKKQQALLNKKYPIIDVPSTGKCGWHNGAYTLCFVYSKYKGNFVLRGYYNEVSEYLKKNYTHYFYNKSLWSHGFHRDIWGFWKENVGIFKPSPNDRRIGKKIEVREYTFANSKNKPTLKFKRLPKRWIPKFDEV